MKKKKLLVLILFIGVICWWFASRKRGSVTEPAPTNEVQPIKANAEIKGPIQPTNQSWQSGETFSNAIPQPASNWMAEYQQKLEADSWEWKMPIDFYGRVLDESNQPVTGASIHFEWNDISEKGTSDAATTSDGNGFFSLTGRRGKRLYVDVGKAGYYSSGDARNTTFEYAYPPGEAFKPNVNNPIIFHLRKKGIGTELVTSKYGVKGSFGVTIPLDGTAVQVDLLERKTGQGPMSITQIKPEYKNWKQASEWMFRMEIPDGGFVEHHDEFPFEAPESGYEPVAQFNFQAGQTNWAINLQKDYYIKFGSPPRYGRLHLETSIMMGGARLTYAINPSGTRNLEPSQ